MANNQAAGDGAVVRLSSPPAKLCLLLDKDSMRVGEFRSVGVG